VTLEDQARLLAALPQFRRELFLCALDTGARLGELLRITWGDVDLASRSILVRRTKSGRPRLVRLTARLTRALDALGTSRPAEAPDADPVFAAAVGRDGNLKWSWRRSFKKAAASIGQPKLRVHDLRHLAAINLVRASVDLPTIQAHLGHRHLVSTLRYAAYADETASARAARTLDRIYGEET
jgi:integrase